MANCCPQRKIKNAVEVFTYRAELECGHRVEITLARGELPPADTCCPKCRSAEVAQHIANHIAQMQGVPDGVKPD